VDGERDEALLLRALHHALSERAFADFWEEGENVYAHGGGELPISGFQLPIYSEPVASGFPDFPACQPRGRFPSSATLCGFACETLGRRMNCHPAGRGRD
jgi:hypothetical protein